MIFWFGDTHIARIWTPGTVPRRIKTGKPRSFSWCSGGDVAGYRDLYRFVLSLKPRLLEVVFVPSRVVFLFQKKNSRRKHLILKQPYLGLCRTPKFNRSHFEVDQKEHGNKLFTKTNTESTSGKNATYGLYLHLFTLRKRFSFIRVLSMNKMVYKKGSSKLNHVCVWKHLTTRWTFCTLSTRFLSRGPERVGGVSGQRRHPPPPGANVPALFFLFRKWQEAKPRTSFFDPFSSRTTMWPT